MTLLDTNALSALTCREAGPAVVARLDAQPPESIRTTSINVLEIRFGLEMLANGRRRKSLEKAFAGGLDEDFDGRILAFDQAAAEAAAAIAARHREAGRPGEIRDVRIAGITAARKASLATRHIGIFDGTKIALLNPRLN